MNNYTQDYLTNLLTTDREKLTRICAEVCYGWTWNKSEHTIFLPIGPDGNIIKNSEDFQPLDNTEKGRSQAFELMAKFKIEPIFSSNEISYPLKNPVHVRQPYDWFEMHEDLQADIVIAAILTAQEQNK